MKILTVPTNGTASVGSAESVLILPANPRRSLAMITNPAAVGIFITLGAPGAIGTGAYLAPGGAFVTDETSGLYRGPIYGIMVSGGAVVLGTLELQ